jgi:nucleotide-binding universal stress UspA family protein
MTWFSSRTTVVPVDFSEASLRAVDVARDLVDDARQLQIVHVLPSITAAEPGLLWNVLDEATARDQAYAELEKRFTDARFAGANLVVAFGSAADEIVELARAAKAELIVMPSHGRTGLARLMIGSVAELVTRSAPCPVLILRD